VATISAAKNLIYLLFTKVAKVIVLNTVCVWGERSEFLDSI